MPGYSNLQNGAWSRLQTAPSDTISVISEEVFTANHLTDTDKQNSTGKYTNYMELRKASNTATLKQNYPGSDASYDTRQGNEVGSSNLPNQKVSILPKFRSQ